MASPASKSLLAPAIAIRRSRPKSLALLALVVCIFYWLFVSSGSSREARLPPPVAQFGSPNVVIVTAFTPETLLFKGRIVRNREEYAKRHGYGLFLADSTDYDLDDAPASWAKVPALRHAMTTFPYSTFFFYISPSSLFANMDISIDKHIVNPARLRESMLLNVPVVPPDSVIKTFSRLVPEKVDLILSHEHDGLGKDSLIIRRGDWAKFMLDVWFDPLYRSYNFQKAEQHALEHIVQWHGSILAKLAVVPQFLINSYTSPEASRASANGVYKTGHFIANFGNCHVPPRDCEKEMAALVGA